MKVIAITGGIGSGKSTFLKTLRSLNQCIESADKICQHITSDDREIEKIKPALIREFGKDIFIHERIIDRVKLATIVFDSPVKRLALESIIIPRMNEIFEERKKLHKDCDILFYEVPTLFENSQESKFDKIILVTAPKATRIERVVERQRYTGKEITAKEVQKRIDAQMPEHEKISKSDYVYYNDVEGSEDEMRVWIKENLGIEEEQCSVTFNFSSLLSREAFVSWLCNSGEQNYWGSCESCDDPAVQFDYWSNNKPFRHIHDEGETFCASLSNEEIFIPTKEIL